MRKLIIIAVIIIAVGVGVYFIIGGKDKLADLDELPSSDDSANSSPLAPGEPDPIFAQPLVYKSLSQSYNSADFSFKHPEGFNVLRSDLNNGGLTSTGGEVVTIENSDGSGFQIFSMPWDEPGSITPERIWEDEPEADIIDPKNADLDGSEALVFYGYNGDIGETFEVWTVRKGKLYQITGPKTAEQLIIDTLETWEWK